MENKLILICAPSGSGKTSVARSLVTADNRFKNVQVFTTGNIRKDEIERGEKIHVSLHDLYKMYKRGELVNFNEKDGVCYGITYEEINNLFRLNKNPVLEWDINRINYWDNIYPNYKVILIPSSKENVLNSIKDGKDHNGKRVVGIIQEYDDIKSGKIQGNLILTNYDKALSDTVELIRTSFFKNAPASIQMK